MTNKHFEEFAILIKQNIDYALCYPHTAERKIEIARSEFSLICAVAQKNPKFDKLKFKKACGLEGMN